PALPRHLRRAPAVRRGWPSRRLVPRGLRSAGQRPSVTRHDLRLPCLVHRPGLPVPSQLTAWISRTVTVALPACTGTGHGGEGNVPLSPVLSVHLTVQRAVTVSL